MLAICELEKSLLPEIVELWNRSFTEHHGFFPLTTQIFSEHLFAAPNFVNSRFLIGYENHRPIALLHYDTIAMNPYPRAGAILALAVAPEFRRRGYGQQILIAALERLAQENIDLVDAGGAWPYSSFYTGLIDGSERAGIDCHNFAARRLFAKNSFLDMQESCRLRRRLTLQKIIPTAQVIRSARSPNASWLDTAFRFWRANDHFLIENGEPVSTAIYARMQGYADFCHQEIYAIYGVNTAPQFRRRGLAEKNFLHLFAELAQQGGEMVELHTYSDNLPALHLYHKLGFTETGRTMIMRRRQ